MQVIAVIMVTGTDEVKVAREFLNFGTENILAYDYITKPFQFENLLPLIEKAVIEVDSKRQVTISTIP